MVLIAAYVVSNERILKFVGTLLLRIDLAPVLLCSELISFKVNNLVILSASLLSEYLKTVIQIFAHLGCVEYI